MLLEYKAHFVLAAGDDCTQNWFQIFEQPEEYMLRFGRRGLEQSKLRSPSLDAKFKLC